MGLSLLMGVIAAAIAMILVLWFQKEAFVEYMSLLGIDELFHITMYKDMKTSDPVLTYPKFLSMHWNNFFIRLITCPVCLGTWLSGVASAGVCGVLYFATCNIFMMLGWPVISLTTAYVALFLYYKLVNMMERYDR
jgi:hypothetical protein